MEASRQVEIMEAALKRIAKLYGNPNNPQEAVLIARESLALAQSALRATGK